MKIVGITRIRNEQKIIKNTLEHVSKFVDEIYVYDDHSTDNTIEICLENKKVKGIIKTKKWEKDPYKRLVLEGSQRQKVYHMAMARSSPDWIYYFDADEYADFEGVDLGDKKISAFKMRLFDFYITPEDIEASYLDRQYMGPEYRDILTLFRPTSTVKFHHREPIGIVGKIKKNGFIKHYGKAISVEQWEDTCEYYINYLYEPQPNNSTISDKWRKRKGKAIHHGFSDFNRKLILWEDRKNESLIINNNNGVAE